MQLKPSRHLQQYSDLWIRMPLSSSGYCFDDIIWTEQNIGSWRWPLSERGILRKVPFAFEQVLHSFQIVKYELNFVDIIPEEFTNCSFHFLKDHLIKNPIFFKSAFGNRLTLYGPVLEELKQISEFYHDPVSWYTGQFMKYIRRYNSHSDQLIKRTAKEFNILRPYTG